MSTLDTSATSYRVKTWLLMFLATCGVMLATLVVFGAVGGLFVAVAIDRLYQPAFDVGLAIYGLLVLVGSCVVATRINRRIARRRYAGTREVGREPLLIALGATIMLAIFGPLLSFFILMFLPFM